MNWLSRNSLRVYLASNPDLPRGAEIPDDGVDLDAVPESETKTLLYGGAEPSRLPDVPEWMEGEGSTTLWWCYGPISVMIVALLYMWGSFLYARLAPVYTPPAKRSWASMVAALVREFFIGVISTSGRFAAVDEEALAHTHVIGGTKTGKSYRFLFPLAQQAIRRRTNSVVYLDLKGTPGLAQALAREAKAAGLPFRCFSLEPDLATNIYNPLTQRHAAKYTAGRRGQVLLAGFGIDYGAGYGREHFTTAGEAFLRDLLSMKKPWRKLSDMKEFVKDRVDAKRVLNMTDAQWDKASQVWMTLNNVGDLLAASLEKGDVERSVADAAIEIEDFFSKPHVALFHLPVSVEPVTARIFGRYVANDIVAYARIHRGPKVPILLIADEGQHLLGPTFANEFSQSRDSGISLVLAHQAMSQLSVEDRSYLGEIIANASTKIYFGPYADKESAEVISRMSGETVRILLGRDSQGRTSEREVLAPRLGPEEMNAISRVPGRAIVDVRPAVGVSRFTQPLLVDLDFSMSKEEYLDVVNDPWPGDPAETIIASTWKPPTARRPAVFDAILGAR